MTKGYLRYALIVIFSANFLSYFDRQIISVLEEDLTGAFGFGKEEFGYLVTAFTIGYMVFAPIVGFMTDRYRRTRIFAVCIVLWSFATIGSGLATTKWVLYATRFFIGIGEAGCLVIGPTLLSDYFPKERRGRALSVFFLALPLGGAAGYIIGGLLAKAIGWRNAFYFAGGPGFLVAALVWWLFEPRRGASDQEPAQAPTPPAPAPPATGPAAAAPPAPATPPEPAAAEKGFRPYLRLLRNRTLLFIILAQTFAVIFLQPLLHFGVKYFQDKYTFDKAQASMTLGTIAVVSGALGSTLSGILGDRLARRLRGAYALMAGVAFALGIPFLLTGFFIDAKAVALPALGIGAFCYFLCMPAVNTHIANVVSANQRAMAYGMAVFILHLLGDMAAPPVFGRIADTLGSQKTFIMFSFALLPAAACCFLAARAAPATPAGPVAPPPHGH